MKTAEEKEEVEGGSQARNSIIHTHSERYRRSTTVTRPRRRGWFKKGSVGEGRRRGRVFSRRRTEKVYILFQSDRGGGS